MSIELRLAELELRCEEYRMLDETADAIPFRMTPDLSRFTYIGPQAEGLLGIRKTSWYEPGFFEARLAPDERTATVEQCRLVVEFGAPHEAEFRLRRDDDSWVWVRCAMRVFESKTGAVTLTGHFFDITVRRSLASDLSQVQRLEAVGRLASGVAHEINTPVQFIGDNLTFITEGVHSLLTVLKGYRELELGEADTKRLAGIAETMDLEYLTTNLEPALARSAEGLERVATLVRSMKAFACGDSQVKQPHDINAALISTIVISTSEYKYVADLKTELGELPAVVCHISELNQVFLNIIVNAAHAVADVMATTGKRGTITITTSREGNNVVVAIADTGTGIPEAIRARIFEPFFTTKDVGKGTGQGLAIAHTIISQHGGSISVDSTTGEGTTFYVRIPING
ncbi:MAG: ATP-binding protein [Kofleriaceae bacterium]